MKLVGLVQIAKGAPLPKLAPVHVDKQERERVARVDGVRRQEARA